MVTVQFASANAIGLMSVVSAVEPTPGPGTRHVTLALFTPPPCTRDPAANCQPGRRAHTGSGRWACSLKPHRPRTRPSCSTVRSAAHPHGTAAMRGVSIPRLMPNRAPGRAATRDPARDQSIMTRIGTGVGAWHAPRRLTDSPLVPCVVVHKASPVEQSARCREQVKRRHPWTQPTTTGASWGHPGHFSPSLSADFCPLT
jgi:hypothetical protein